METHKFHKCWLVQQGHERGNGDEVPLSIDEGIFTGRQLNLNSRVHAHGGTQECLH